MGSAQVSWWSVHEWVQPYLQDAGPLPMAGTPEWCDLDDTDPRKVAAVLDAGEHHALRMEIGQQQLAEASRDVSAAEDWPAVAAEIYRRRTSGYIPQEKAS